MKKNDPALEKVLTIIKDLKGVFIVVKQGWCLLPVFPGFDAICGLSLLLILFLLREFFLELVYLSF